MSRFSQEVWQATRELRAAIHSLPFNTELAAGSLARERFRHYITQDALYLSQFSRCLAIAAAKRPTPPFCNPLPSRHFARLLSNEPCTNGICGSTASIP